MMCHCSSVALLIGLGGCPPSHALILRSSSGGRCKNLKQKNVRYVLIIDILTSLSGVVWSGIGKAKGGRSVGAAGGVTLRSYHQTEPCGAAYVFLRLLGPRGWGVLPLS